MRAQRKTLIDSLAFIVQRFPMFTEIDLDWEYPGNAGGAGNPHGPEDAGNFQTLVRELKQRPPSIRVSIAAGASMATLLTSDIKGMIASGVEGINLMTYDYFGTPWAPKLAHHLRTCSIPIRRTLKATGIDRAVKYLLGQGVPSTNINIGFAAYSRSGRNAVIDSWSPLAGHLQPGLPAPPPARSSRAPRNSSTCCTTTSTWSTRPASTASTSIRTRWPTRTICTALESGLFLSIDTPRSVYAKGEYVRKHNLGGLFTWTIDMDSGVLVNAAREGLGAPVQTRVVNMDPFYFLGINVQDGGRAPVAVIDGPTEAFEGDDVEFTALRSRASST